MPTSNKTNSSKKRPHSEINQQFVSAAELAKLRRLNTDITLSTSSSSMEVYSPSKIEKDEQKKRALQKRQRTTKSVHEFNLQVGDIFDWYMSGYGWYTAKVNRQLMDVSMTRKPEVELLNFDHHPDDRWVRKFRIDLLTKRGQKVWAPFGTKTCEVPYVHDSDADLSIQERLTNLLTSLKSQRISRNADKNIPVDEYLYYSFRQPVIELWPEIQSEYCNIIEKPMDMKTLLENVQTNVYSSVLFDNVIGFFDDLSLIWRNAIQWSLYDCSRESSVKSSPHFFPFHAALALRIYSCKIASDAFDIHDLLNKYPLPEKVRADAFYPKKV